MEATAQQLSIYPLHPFKETDTINNKIVKYKYFIVTNYQYGNEKQLKRIKRFVKESLDKDYREFLKYFVVIYKESNAVTRNFRQTESDLLAWHGKSYTKVAGLFNLYTLFLGLKAEV